MLFGTSLFFAITASCQALAALSVVTGILFAFSLPIIATQVSGICVSRGFGLEQKTRFLVEIRDINPGMNMPKWDIVASRMNDYLFEAKYYRNKYALYDGKSCLDGFKEVYLLPRKDVFDVTPLNDSGPR